jgi:dehydrogenase/reductase SDR family protein 4
MTPANPCDLTGRVALVTGSSRGIGKAIAQIFAAAGAKVVITSRKADACQAVVEEIEAAGGQALAVACNVLRRDQVEALVQETQSKLGNISVLVCNAATNPVYGPMADLDDKAFDKVMATNVGANIHLINLAAPGMAARGGGSVILLSSIAGLMGSGTIGVYAVSKAADIQLARNYAVDLGLQNIRVNAILPGLIRTGFSTVLWEGERGKRFIDRTPLGRLGEADDIAGVALFLASDISKFVTGQGIVADGGVMISDPFLE